MTKPFTSRVVLAILLSFWTLGASYAQDTIVKSTVRDIQPEFFAEKRKGQISLKE